MTQPHDRWRGPEYSSRRTSRRRGVFAGVATLPRARFCVGGELVVK